MKLSKIAEFLNISIDEDVMNTDISGVSSLDMAKTGDLSFLEESRHLEKAELSKATAVLLKEKHPSIRCIQLIHPEPKWAFSKVANKILESHRPYKGISDKAVISKSAKIGKNTTIHPLAVIEDHVSIGDDCHIYPHTYIAEGVSIGNSTIIKANVTIENKTSIGSNCMIHGGTTIGGDGFGFTPGRDGLEKFPQIGGVIIEDDVEIGACCTIDCGAMNDTIIKRGTKLDSNVHVAHNATIGENTMLCGSSSVAGSAKVGNNCIIGGASAVKDHIELSDGVILGGFTAAIGSIKKPGIYVGFPAVDHVSWKMQLASLRMVPSLRDKVLDIEKKLK